MIPDAHIKFGARAREARVAARLSLRQVAATIGVSATSLGSWETGKRPIPRARRRQIAELFCLDGRQPKPNGGLGDVWGEIIAGLKLLPAWGSPPREKLVAMCEARRAVGIARYGQPLRRHDGRDHRRDLVEECLDGAAYACSQRLPTLSRVLLRIAECPEEAEEELREAFEQAGAWRREEAGDG